MRWLLLALLLVSCRGEPALPEGWQPAGPIDAVARLSAPSVSLLAPASAQLVASPGRSHLPPSIFSVLRLAGHCARKR